MAKFAAILSTFSLLDTCVSPITKKLVFVPFLLVLNVLTSDHCFPSPTRYSYCVFLVKPVASTLLTLTDLFNSSFDEPKKLCILLVPSIFLNAFSPFLS